MTQGVVMHFDLDAFFASVEQRLRPELAGRPVAVGGGGPRGVVATASYEARRSGVGSAMGMGLALRKCPALVVVPPRFAAYKSVSEKVMAWARELGPTEPLSLDEAYVALGGGEDEAVVRARELRARVRAELGLALSVGLGSTKMVAKLASDDAKPDGLRLVRSGREDAYLHDMPVGRVSGVGPVSAARLSEIGVRTISDLKAIERTTLTSLLGASAGDWLWSLARNRDPRTVQAHQERKSVGSERTFDRDVADPGEIRELVIAAARSTSARLAKAGLAGRTVTLKARMWDFRTLTRSLTLESAIDDRGAITETALSLLESVDLSEGVRLLGVSVSSLGPTSQGVLFGDESELEDVEEAPTLRERIHWGMTVEHAHWGDGRVLSLRGDTLEVSFPGRVRLLDIDSPVLQ